MSALNRRHFLQFAGSTLATLGFSQLDIINQSIRYAKTLAQGTPRKLALLVGINAYPESSQFTPLQGCLTDVELQRQLLIHRFGFNPKDIVTLTDAAATRQGILTTFEQHLIQQAKPGDVAVFHYSGHGSQVTDPDKDEPDGLNSTFVPVDSVLPKNFPDQGGPVKDIMGHTLFLLMSALQTENVTVVLDSCHSGGGTRGNLRIRSRSGGATLKPDPMELEYQQQWLSKLNLSPADYIRLRRTGVAKGVVIASTKRDQLAADAPFSDFYAGAFTYLMTQYLWQQTATAILGSAIPNIARSTTRASSSNQEPVFEIKPGSNNNKKPLYFTSELTTPAEAVVTKVEGDRAELWLGGINPQNLAAFEKDAVLIAIDRNGKTRGQVKLESREGLIGRGKLLNAVQPGLLLQEQVRGIPTQLTLKIGLDPSLGNDITQAKQLIQAMQRMQALPLQTGEVNYILGRMTESYRRQLTVSSPPPVGSIGLFYPGLDLVPDSFSSPTESISDAVTRLQPKLKSLLAARIVKLTLNPNSSRLNVSVSMTPEGKSNQLIASTFAIRGKAPAAQSQTSVGDPKKLPLGTSLQFQITNNEPRNLYFSVLVIDAIGEMSVIFPNQWVASAEVMKVAAGQTLIIPEPSKDSFRLVTQEPKGTTEVLIIASSTPLGNALKALQGVASSRGQSRGPIGLTDPNDLISNLLNDIGTSTRSQSAPSSPSYSIDVSQLAALSITFEVI